MTVTASEFPTFPTFAPQSQDWPAPLGDAAFHGIAGDIVKAIAPHSEADPAALLLQFLAAFGSAAGRDAGVRVEADRHCGNLFVLIVGATSKGRKGSSRRQATRPVELADPEWASRITTGLVSGEGLIHEVRDPLVARRKAKNERERAQADEDGYIEEEVDPGTPDKRCLIIESEFASTLRVMGRDGSTLSPVVRQAWDGGDLRTMAKGCPTRATDSHISAIGHITADELKRELTAADTGNGFANRFLTVCSRRSKLLPHGGHAHEIDWAPIVEDLQRSLKFAGIAGDMAFDAAASAIWEVAYEQMADGHPGMLGAVTGRAEAQTLRLALLYALLDRADAIRTEHLQAALAVWFYCERSAAYLFGTKLGDKVADSVLSYLRDRPNGMSRTDMREVLGGRVPGEQVDRALVLLADSKLAHGVRETTGGRPVERWHAGVGNVGNVGKS